MQRTKQLSFRKTQMNTGLMLHLHTAKLMCTISWGSGMTSTINRNHINAKQDYQRMRQAIQIYYYDEYCFIKMASCLRIIMHIDGQRVRDIEIIVNGLWFDGETL